MTVIKCHKCGKVAIPDPDPVAARLNAMQNGFTFHPFDDGFRKMELCWCADCAPVLSSYMEGMRRG